MQYGLIFKCLAYAIGVGFVLFAAVLPIINEHREQRAADARRSRQIQSELDAVERDYEKHFGGRQ